MRPHRLDDHLGKLHSKQGGVQIAVRADNVDHGVNQFDRLLHNQLLVHSQINVQWLSIEVALKQQVRLRLRLVVVV